MGSGRIVQPYAIIVCCGEVGTVICQPAGTHCSNVSPRCSTRTRTPSGNSLAAIVDLASVGAGLKSIHCSACGIILSTTNCQSAQPVVSGLFNSILPVELPALRETRS